MTRNPTIPRTSETLVRNAGTLAVTRSGAELHQTRATMTRSTDRCSCAAESMDTSLLPSSKRAAKALCRQTASRPAGRAKVQRFFWPKATSCPRACVIFQERLQYPLARARSAPRTRNILPMRPKESRSLPLCHLPHTNGKDTRNPRSHLFMDLHSLTDMRSLLPGHRSHQQFHL